MSTKNLARTVIEGGRAHSNRWERRYSNARERAHERVVSAGLLTASDLDGVIYSPREVVYREFSDKLAPAERWLAGQVGRPWNKVRGELFARFDTRTTAGRHILFDHLLRSVNLGAPPTFGRVRFTVDRHGMLRREAPYRPWRSARWEPLPEPQRVLEAWLGGRRVGSRGERLYWFVETESGAFRQHHLLNDVDAARWYSLPKWFRVQFDAFSPPASILEK
jgi:hypothetical protein